MPFFSRFKNKGQTGIPKSQTEADLPNGQPAVPQKKGWESTWNSKTVVPEEVEELIHTCTAEMKSRAEALDSPFLLLPFRPDSDPSSARAFIRNYYRANGEGSRQYTGHALQQELRLTDPVVLCSLMKWCWSRMPGGVVTWAVYEGFQLGEQEANLARNAFSTFVPITADSSARKNIIFDFFDLLCAVAAHGKLNGLGGRKLSRLAGWWAFEHTDEGNGFEGGYKSWLKAANASSHLFFAYLRHLSPEADPSMSVIERIPRSLQALLASTEYPPETPTLLQRTTPRVVMMVDSVSPTPFALLRRAAHFEFGDDKVLQEYSEFEDPVDALTEENKRVLYSISTTNSSAAKSRHRAIAPGKHPDESWSAFQNLGFADMDENSLQSPGPDGGPNKPSCQGLRSEPRSRNVENARPTTPSWADFLSSGFVEDEENSLKPSTTLIIPPEKQLGPLTKPGQTPSHVPGEDQENIAPGELAAVTNVDLDDAFWWVWMTSLAQEEPNERKAVFGRCALIETSIGRGKWLIMEEQVKGASPEPEQATYVVQQKKSFFGGLTKRGRQARKAESKKSVPRVQDSQQARAATSPTPSKSSLAPGQQDKIKQAAAVLKGQELSAADAYNRRGRHDDTQSNKTNSMMTTGLTNDAGPAMKWASAYDKKAIRAQYLGDSFAGRGGSREDLLSNRASSVNMTGDRGSMMMPSVPPGSSQQPATVPTSASSRELPALPKDEQPEAQVEQREQPQHQEPSQTAHSPPTINVEPSYPDEKHPSQENGQQVEREIPETYAPTGPQHIADAPAEPKPNKIGRKPVRSGDIQQQHPAFRQQSADGAAPKPFSHTDEPQSPTSHKSNPAAAAAAVAMKSSSPESKKSGHGKLKKQNPPSSSSAGGLKKFFGRKKDNTNRQSVDAFSTNNNANHLAPPEESGNFTRRLSLMRKKPTKTSTPQDNNAALSQLTGEQPQQSAAASEPQGYYTNNSSANVSHVDSNDRKDANQEFSRFDQGPLEDMPAMTPEVSHETYAPPPQTQQQHQRPEHYQPEAYQPTHNRDVSPVNDPDSFSTPMEPPTAAADNDAASEATMEDRREPSVEQDRWAHIRRNAANRAAQRDEQTRREEHSLHEKESLHEQESRPSQSARTEDDGETSGEETIESRVARIKARVAELTGNMDGESGAQARR